MMTITGDIVFPKGSERGGDGVPSLYSIGTGLGRMPRFAGQTPIYYPVLCHVLTVADLVPPQFRIYALLHDAAEALVGDVPTPWKTDAARAAEDDILERLTVSLGLSWPWPEDAHKAVKEADALALAAEAHVLGHPAASEWWEGADTAEETANARRLTLDRIPTAFSWLQHSFAGPAYERHVINALEKLAVPHE